MITKTLTGVSLIDERYGGIYRGRAMLVCGGSGAGKTVFGLQFIQQGLRQGERCLMLSARTAADQVIYAEAMNFPVGDPINSGHLILLEYQNFVPGRDREENLTLPPDGFLQLKEIIETHVVQRVVLDTTLPWVTIPSQAKLAQRVFSFVRAFDRMNTTTLLTIPKPVSLIAHRLKNALENVVPVSVMMTSDRDSGKRFLNVTKYLGENKLFPETEYEIAPRAGITQVDAAKYRGNSQSKSEAPPPGIPAHSAPPEPRAKASFRSVIPPGGAASAPEKPGGDASQTPPKRSFGSFISRGTADADAPIPTESEIMDWLQKKTPRKDEDQP